MMKSVEIDPRSEDIPDLTTRFEVNSNQLKPFGLAIFQGVFKNFYIFRLYFKIFLKNILKYLRVEEFLKYFLKI